MAETDSPAAGPNTDEFLGPARHLAAKRLFHATRPKFFPASVLPVLAGSAWGYMQAGQFDGIVFLLALIATVLVHAGANVLNDVSDDSNGTDRLNSDRIYPYTGGSRFIQTGIMTSAGMARLGVSLFAVALLLGLWLVALKGVMVIWFGLAGALLAIVYSLGPVKLSSLGLGELSVAVAFGVLPVTGAAWLQSGMIDISVLLFSLPISMWVAAILLINEVPDISADSTTGKHTLAVRLGTSGTGVLYAAMHLVAVAVVAWMTYQLLLPVYAIVIPAGLLILAMNAAATVRNHAADRPRMTKAIEATLGIHTVGSFWLAAVAMFLAFFGA